MNVFYINDDNFKNSSIYHEFIANNPKIGMLKIKAFAAREAIPIEGLRVIVSTISDNNKIIFYDGYTNASGIIDTINLPAPTLDNNNLLSPDKEVYDISAFYPVNNSNYNYKVSIYEDICVVQNIIVDTGDLNGS